MREIYSYPYTSISDMNAALCFTIQMTSFFTDKSESVLILISNLETVKKAMRLAVYDDDSAMAARPQKIIKILPEDVFGVIWLAS